MLSTVVGQSGGQTNTLCPTKMYGARSTEGNLYTLHSVHVMQARAHTHPHTVLTHTHTHMHTQTHRDE